MTLLLLTLLAVQSPRGAETFAAPVQTITVTVKWTHNDQIRDGYRVYLRRSGQNYSNSMDAGTNKVFTFTGLQRKTTYKCVVTTYWRGLESLRSEECTFRTGNRNNDTEEL